MSSAGTAGLTVLREGWQPVRGETPVPAGGSTRSATARPRAAGTRPRPHCPEIGFTATSNKRLRSTRSGTSGSNPVDGGPSLRIKPRIRHALHRVQQRPGSMRPPTKRNAMPCRCRAVGSARLQLNASRHRACLAHKGIGVIEPPTARQTDRHLRDLAGPGRSRAALRRGLRFRARHRRDLGAPVP